MYEVSEAYKSAIAQPTRNFRLSGNIRMQSGEMIALSDSNVVGEMKIETQCMSGSSSEQILDIGAVCAAKLTMTVKNASGSDSFADARVRPLVGLEISKNSFEDIPMGIFYVDNTTVERVKDRVTFSAYDKMIFLHFLLTETMRSNMKNMPPYAACAYVCGLAGIQMAQPSAEVTAFPNGSVLPDYSDASIETARDLIMWCAQLMGCFARIDRHGRLEFVRLKAENDEHGMIIPVREIAARQRYSTKFADGVIRITRLTMKKSDGKMASAAVKYSGSTKRSAELELEQNPLILSLTDKTVRECLRDILSTVKTAYFRPFQSEIASDPALDAGDYVRLRGGSIDTNRGYGTGIITHNVWRYRGKHRIVNVGSVPAMYQLDDESSAAETAAVSEIALLSENTEDDGGSDDVDGTDLVYVPPKSQLEKELDGLRGKTGTGGVGKAVEDDPTCEYFNDYTGNAITGKYPYPYPNSPYEKGYNRVEGHKNTLSDSYGTHVGGADNSVSRTIASHIGGDGNTVEGGYCLLIQGNNNAVHRWEDTDGSRHLLLMGDGNKVGVSGNANFSIVNGINCYLNNTEFAIVLGNENRISKLLYGLILGQLNEINSDYTFAFGKGLKTNGNGSVNNFQIMLGQYNAVAKQIKPKSAMSYGYNILFSLGAGLGSSASRRSTALIIDEAGNIYCNKVYELGSKITSDMVTEKGIIDASSLINQSSIATASAAQTITSASSSGIPIMLLDHTPTANDLTGSECVFLQCDDTASVKGESTGIFRVTDIFAEKSLQ